MRSLRSLLTLVFTLLSTPQIGAQQETGTISGRVVDAKTGRPLPLANVFVQETNRGTMTDLDGNYTILDLPTGIYTIQARFIGCKPSRVRNVRVIAGRTETVDFRLQEETLSPVDLHYYTYPRGRYFSDPFWPDVGTSAVIWKMPGGRLERGRLLDSEAGLDILPGVITGKDGLHVRGGRKSDFVWEVDGTSVSDPLYGDRALSVPLAALRRVDVTTATSEAESRSPLTANVIPKWAVGKFSGGAPIAGRVVSEAEESSPYDADLWLRGPLLRRRELYFLCSGQASGSPSVFLPALSDEKRRAGFLNLHWFVSPAPARLLLNLAGFIREYDRYDHRWMHNPSGLPGSQEKSALSALSWHHTIASGSAYYQLMLGNLRVARDLRVKEKDWEDYLTPSTDPYGWIPSYFFTTGDYPLHHESSERVYFGEGLFGAVLGPTEEVKTGFELKRYHLEADRKELSDTLSNEVKYTYGPSSFAFYLQNHLERPGLILNMGLRTQGFRGDAQGGLKLQLLPRLGVSLPITDKDKVFLSYGHFGQMPPYHFLASERLGWEEGSPVYGNPGLGHERIVSQQAGVQHFLFRRFLTSLSFFKRQGTGLLKLVRGFDLWGPSFTFSNEGRMYSQGFECLAEAVFWKYLRGQVNYTYLLVRGNELRTNRWSELSYYHQLEGRRPPWDRPHSISGDIFLEFKNEGRIGGGEIGMSGRHSSGFPYYVGEEEHTSPAYMVLDWFTKANFRLFGLRESAFVGVLNLLDRENVLDVDQVTGEPGGTFDDPTHWGQGRRTVVGANVEW